MTDRRLSNSAAGPVSRQAVSSTVGLALPTRRSGPARPRPSTSPNLHPRGGADHHRVLRTTNPCVEFTDGAKPSKMPVDRPMVVRGRVDDAHPRTGPADRHAGGRERSAGEPKSPTEAAAQAPSCRGGSSQRARLPCGT